MSFARKLLLEFRIDSFYKKIAAEFPTIDGLPYIIVPPPTEVAPAQLYAPAYRFHDKSGQYLVQAGPNLLAINAVAWDAGYSGFRKIVEHVTTAWREVHVGELAANYSLGFYNKIAVSDVDDVSWLLSEPLPLSAADTFAGFSLQKSQPTKCGAFTSQVVTVEDGSTKERHLLVNNFINYSAEPRPLDVAEWLDWIDRAHELAKDYFWNTLSGHAQDAWNRTYATEKALQ
jgi:uncharacterized protein (TIGR04255 family)